jgi:hypothetical protein
MTSSPPQRKNRVTTRQVSSRKQPCRDFLAFRQSPVSKRKMGRVPRQDAKEAVA